MGLFFYEQQNKYTKRGTKQWPASDTHTQQFLIQGELDEINSNGTVSSEHFYVNDREIFYKKDNHFYSFSLYLTVLQENFCFLDHKKIYQIKLKQKNFLTTLSTTNMQKFIEFYCLMAKYCILTTFEKHFRITKDSHPLNPQHPEQLGHGTYSTVYNGENILSKQEVALKVFNKAKIYEIMHGKLVIENEINILQRLRKYHLSPLIGIYECEDCVIFVLLKAEAGNMLNYLGMHRQDYNGDFIRKIMGKILQNLLQLHTAGFIHRDIKPENILFKNNTVDSSLFLGDFGLTVPIQAQSPSGISKICSGTLAFIAPEILHSSTYNEKCDIFSLGGLFYFLHKGKSLFAGKTVQQIDLMTSNDRIIQQKIGQLQNLTNQSHKLMRQMLRVDPESRPSADQALKYEYFDSIQHFHPETGEDDHTLRDYLLIRINRFYNA